jgi:hypothetical protein
MHWRQTLALDPLNVVHSAMNRAVNGFPTTLCVLRVTGGPFAVINHGKSACAWKADGENQHWNITLAALGAADLELLFDLQGLSACQRRDLPYL